jgi:hypothetical protein
LVSLAGSPGATPAMCPLVSFHERPAHVTVWASAHRKVQNKTLLKIIQSPNFFDIAFSCLEQKLFC